MTDLKGWNHIVYTIIRNHLSNNSFTLEELYKFEPHFKILYPDNYHIKDKIRQTLQNLRNKGLITFLSKGNYKLNLIEKDNAIKNNEQSEYVYLLSNKAIPDWIKIGRTNQIERRLKELYNTSVPLPFKLEEYIITNSIDESRELEKKYS